MYFDYKLSRWFLPGFYFSVALLKSAFADPLQEWQWVAAGGVGPSGRLPPQAIRVAPSVPVRASPALVSRAKPWTQ